MRTRSTLLLLALVLGLLSYILLHERHSGGTLDKREPGPLLALKETDYDAVEVKTPSGLVKFRRSADKEKGWYITEPFDDIPDAASLARIHWLLQRATIGEVLPEKYTSEASLKPFGLNDDSAVHVVARKGGKPVAQLRVGVAGGIGETCYVLKPQSDAPATVYLAFAKENVPDVHICTVLKQSAEQFRLKELFPMPAEQITTLQVQRQDGDGGELVLTRRIEGEQVSKWIITKPLATRAEQKLVTDFIGAYMAAAPTLLPANTTPPGVGTATADLTFTAHEQSKGHTIRLYPKVEGQDFVLAYATRRKAWFKLDPGFAEAVPNSVNDFRSRHLATLEPKAITTVDITEPDRQPTQLYKVDGKWYLRTGEKDFVRGSEETIARTIQSLNKAEIAEFTTDTLSDPVPYGLDKPYVTLTMSDAAHQSLTALGKGTPDGTKVLRMAIGPDKALYAHFQGDTSVFKMQPEHYQLIPTGGLQWRDTNVLSFSPYSVISLKQQLSTQPPTLATRQPMSLQWATATRAEANVLPLLEPSWVEETLAKLSTLSVKAWMPHSAEIHAALQKPCLELEAAVLYRDQSVANGPPVDRQKLIRLTIAPAGPIETTRLFFGKIDEVPDFFTLSRETYTVLSRSWLKEKSK